MAQAILVRSDGPERVAGDCGEPSRKRDAWFWVSVVTYPDGVTSPSRTKWGLIMSMRSLALLAMVVLTVTCGPSPDAKLPGYVVGTGGSNPSAAGGSADTGGTTTVGAGGIAGAGGSSVHGTGGKVGGTGGKGATGGGPGSGGRADGGPGGATGGRSGTGGAEPGTGGSRFGTGGAGTGGMIVRRDAGPDLGGGSDTGGIKRDAPSAQQDSATSCMSQVVSNDYACGSTPACSACKDQNGNSREAVCKKSIDCLAAAGASCDSSCKQNCLNLAGDSPGMACVTALQTAACGAAGCGITQPPNGGG